ncbi:hypothetical protein L2K20_08295 [Mycobacterium sp. MBM]|nr:hypothetical protein [Mycobacterium sp. MBM]
MKMRTLGTLAVALAVAGCTNGAEPVDTSTVAPASTTTTPSTTTTTTTKMGTPSAPEFAPAPGGDLAPA